MSKQMEFFIFLLEQYAAYKNTTADKILQQWDNLELTNFIYGMYEMYHTECLENAFKDIDNLTQNHKHNISKSLPNNPLSLTF